MSGDSDDLFQSVTNFALPGTSSGGPGDLTDDSDDEQLPAGIVPVKKHVPFEDRENYLDTDIVYLGRACLLCRSFIKFQL